MAEFPDVTERGTSLEQPEYSCGHEAKTALSVREKEVDVHRSHLYLRANTLKHQHLTNSINPGLVQRFFLFPSLLSRLFTTPAVPGLRQEFIRTGSSLR
jgi:hypothetical protein